MDQNALLSRMVAGTTMHEAFEKAIHTAAQGKEKVYVDLKSGTFSADKTQDG